MTQVIVHPNYNPNTNNNDIALLKLTSPAVLNSTVAIIPPATSPLVDALVQAGDTSTVTGWGDTTEGGSLADVLMEVTLPIVSNTSCNQAYGFITDNMLCAGLTQGGKDSCQGDSGGPLIVPVGDGSWLLAGIVSSGNGCARPGYPGIYTRVSRYQAWIGQYVPSHHPTHGHADPHTASSAYGHPNRHADLHPHVNAHIHTHGHAHPYPTCTTETLSKVQTGDWDEQSSNDFPLITHATELTRITPHGGSYAAWLGGGASETSILSQTLAIRDAHVFTTLRFFYWIGSEETTCGVDTTTVRFGENNLLAYDLCTGTDTGNWQEKIVDMTPFNGQTHDLVFTTTTNGTLNSNFFLDDVTITQVPNLSEKVYLPATLRAKVDRITKDPNGRLRRGRRHPAPSPRPDPGRRPAEGWCG